MLAISTGDGIISGSHIGERWKAASSKALGGEESSTQPDSLMLESGCGGLEGMHNRLAGLHSSSRSWGLFSRGAGLLRPMRWGRGTLSLTSSLCADDLGSSLGSRESLSEAESCGDGDNEGDDTGDFVAAA